MAWLNVVGIIAAIFLALRLIVWYFLFVMRDSNPIPRNDGTMRCPKCKIVWSKKTMEGIAGMGLRPLCLHCEK